jgi:serine phosphatase RsbU (regulator of sigma subunit)/anti-sigma regulatory factor (Ser/Thr protein kinase)
MVGKENFEAKILVLDDERLIRMTVCARLKQAGYEAVPAGTVEEAMAMLKARYKSFCAIISDVVMGEMDGFMFRDMVRGIDSNIPIFFMTALDPEEGSGFLKKIISDPMCYYLPKSVGTEVLVKRMQRVVGARRIQQFVENQVTEQRRSLSLAAHVQCNMLSTRAMMDERCFYTTLWSPHESVSGDLYEAMPTDSGHMLFVLGDIQGHGTNAALVMMAVQAFLRQTVHTHEWRKTLVPEFIANELQGFFRLNFADVSYMTALICLYTPPAVPGEGGGTVTGISCGASDLLVVDALSAQAMPVNPQHRGGLPIGLMPDTVYKPDDVVTIDLPSGAMCVACTDGLVEISQDADGHEKIPKDILAKVGLETIADSYASAGMTAAPDKFMAVCAELGYRTLHDDVTLLLFGARALLPDVYEATTQLSPSLVDAASQAMAAWCSERGWPEDLVPRVQLVLEEHLMNVYDHGFNDQQRRKDVVSIRLKRVRDQVQLTVWDRGLPPPSLKVAAGHADTAFDLANMKMNTRGRGRLMVRKLCNGIQRQRFAAMNETIFHIPITVQ